VETNSTIFVLVDKLLSHPVWGGSGKKIGGKSPHPGGMVKFFSKFSPHPGGGCGMVVEGGGGGSIIIFSCPG